MNTIDFLPERIRHQRSRRAALQRQAVLLGLVAGLLGLWAWANQGRIDQAEAHCQALAGSRQAVQNQIALIPDYQRQLEAGQVKVRISRELGSRLDLQAVLAELSRLLPPSAALTGLECRTVEVSLRPTASMLTGGARAASAGGLTLKAPTEARVKLLITGICPTDVDVANFIGQLSACPLFEDVNMGYAKTEMVDQKQRKARSFEVSCLLAR